MVNNNSERTTVWLDTQEQSALEKVQVANSMVTLMQAARHCILHEARRASKGDRKIEAPDRCKDRRPRLMTLRMSPAMILCIDTIKDAYGFEYTSDAVRTAILEEAKQCQP